MAKALSRDDDLESFYAAATDIKLEIGAYIYAKSAYLNTPRDFYIVPRPLMLNLPVLTIVRMQCPTEDLKINASIIFHSQTVMRNVRGVIQDINEKCSIYAIDYGFTEGDVSRNDIYLPLHEEALTIPPLAIHCEMYLCCPLLDEFSSDAIKAFKYYMGNSNQEILKVYLKGKVNDKFIVTIYNSCANDIATMLFLMGNTTFQSIKNYNRTTPDRNQEPETTFLFRKATVGRKLNVKVQYVEKQGNFYAMPISFYQKYVDTRSEFHSYCESMFELNPGDCVINAAVGVKGDSGMYERGIITDVIGSNEKVKIKLVDLGQEVIVELSEAVPVYSNINTADLSYCIFCSLVKDFKPEDHGLPEDFLRQGNTFTITVEEVGDGFQTPYIVSVSKLNTKVQESGK